MNALLPHARAAVRPSLGQAGLCASFWRTKETPPPSPLRTWPPAGLLFDPENVFYDATLWRRWLSQLLGRMGTGAPFPDFFTVWDREFRADVDLGRRDYWDALREFLAHQGLSSGMIAEICAAGEHRKQRFEANPRCMPGVVETLARLAARGVVLAALSNSPRSAEEMTAELEAMGLRTLLHVVLTSRDLGRVMPAEMCYRQACDRMGLQPEEVAFVGSQAESLAGAQRCGMRVIAFNNSAEVAGCAGLERFSDLACWTQAAPWRRLAG